MYRLKAFLYEASTGVVEPEAGGVLGAWIVLLVSAVLPCALAFAACAMLFVVEELIPESQHAGNTNFATLGAMFGFTIMMTLDVAPG